MAATKEELIEWLNDLPDGTLIAIDDGGLCLRVVDENAYYEIGGMPEAEDEDEVRHTACKHCGQDIEGVAPFLAGEWRDRGNNPTCPTPEGDAGQKHEPTS